MMSVRLGHALRVVPLPLVALGVGVTTLLWLAGCAGRGAGNPEPEGGAVGNGWVEITPKPEGDGPVTTIIGTVQHLDVEGGIFAIQDAGGTNYNPTNLPGEFREDGKVVEVEARQRDDVMSIGMVGPVINVVRIRARTLGTVVTVPALAGTRWRLVDLAGAGVVGDAPATLEFGEGGRVSGNGTCNTFRGTATIAGDAITFGPLAMTRKACDGPLMSQENAYLGALGEALRYEIKDGALYIHVSRRPAPLRFVAE